jgi:tripartite-type tricarboxylate transporter receptor subunit TctC
MRRTSAAVAAISLTGALSAATPVAHAQIGALSPSDPREFFKGKTLTYIIATEPGGGYDTYGRLIAKYLRKHLGLARVDIRNLPGGGHIDGVNEIYAAAPDGLTLGIFNTGVVYAQLLRNPAVRFDLGRMSWIGKAGDEPRVLTVSTQSGFGSLDDIRKAGRPLVLGASGAGSGSYNDMALLAHALGLEVRYVFGLATHDAQLAMLRREIDGAFGSASSYRAFVKSGRGVTVLRVGEGSSVDPAVPAAKDLVSTPEAKAIVDLVRSQASLLRWTAGPPGIRPDRLSVLRAAYMAALRDPELITEARKFDIPIVPTDGATLAGEVRRVLDQPAATLNIIASVIGGTPKASKMKARIEAVQPDGSRVRFTAGEEEIVADLRDARTKIFVDTRAAGPAALKVGMACDIRYLDEDNEQPMEIKCSTGPLR